MADARETVELTCPHCHRGFHAEQIGAAAQRGFKCPHCRLFVPVERARETAKPTSRR